MKPETIAALEQEFAEFPVMVAGPISHSEVEELQRKVSFVLPSDYRDFVSRYGGAIVGPFPIFGLRAAKSMARNESSVLEVTKRFQDNEWAGVKEWLIVSMDHSGNPVGLDRNGKVWISDHDAGAIQELAPTFEAYLRRWCLKLEA